MTPPQGDVGSTSEGKLPESLPFPSYRNVREFEMEAVSVIVEGLQSEHPYIRDMVIGPVISYMQEVCVHGDSICIRFST